VFILAAALIVAGVALFVAAPLGIGLSRARAKSAGEIQAERLEHDRALAVQGLHELEFDRQMGKLSATDYDAMHSSLENRALTAMAAIEKIRTEAAVAEAAAKKQAPVIPLVDALRRLTPLPRRTDNIPTLVVRQEPPRSTAPRKIRFCPQCGTRTAPDSNFCAECGAAFKPSARATNWTE
jgi:cytochrome c-type biogenesis protein CcmI